MSNTFGNLFRVTTFGESHGPGLGVVIDGCPAGLKISIDDIQLELNRRKPGQSKITTGRSETDRVQILSGIFEGISLGTPIAMIIMNSDADSPAYDNLKDLYRPGHADFTYEMRYGVRDWRGGGRASARETVARVASGAIAQIMLKELAGLETLAWVDQIHNLKADINLQDVTKNEVEKNMVRCPDQRTAGEMITAISEAKARGDSLGGKIGFRIDNCPAGLGAPVFDKLTAELARACMSIPASRTVSFGLGSKVLEMTGYEHNDRFVIKNGKRIGTETNNAGGLLGGISNGEQIYGTVVFKPVATIGRRQKTISTSFKEIEFQAGGRHDPCVLPRAVPIVEAMINLVMADHILQYSIATIDRLKKIFNHDKESNKFG